MTTTALFYLHQCRVVVAVEQRGVPADTQSLLSSARPDSYLPPPPLSVTRILTLLLSFLLPSLYLLSLYLSISYSPSLRLSSCPDCFISSLSHATLSLSRSLHLSLTRSLSRSLPLCLSVSFSLCLLQSFCISLLRSRSLCLSISPSLSRFPLFVLSLSVSCSLSLCLCVPLTSGSDSVEVSHQLIMHAMYLEQGSPFMLHYFPPGISPSINSSR